MIEDEVRKIVLEVLRELLPGAYTKVRFKDADGDEVSIRYVDEDFQEHVHHELEVIEEKRHRGY